MGSVLVLFASIGLYIAATYEFQGSGALLVYGFLFGFLPALAGIGTWLGQRWALLLALLFFASQSLREIGPDNLLPFARPIALAFPVSDFVGDSVYLVDVFAMTMALIFAYLLWSTRPNPRPAKSD